MELADLVGRLAEDLGDRLQIVACLSRAGLDPADTCGPEIGKLLEVLDAAPEFIRTAEFLGLDERLRLATVTADAPEDIILLAKQATVDHFRKLRADEDTDGAGADEDGLPMGPVTAIFDAHVEHLRLEQQTAAEDQLFAGHDRLVTAVVARLKGLDGSLIAGRPATEVLAERLRGLPPPEFVLLASGLLGSPDPARRWLAAIAVGDVRPERASHKQVPPRRSK